MANQIVTTTVNFDSDSVLGLENGETTTINGGSVTIDADNRWGQNNAVIGSVAISDTLGGSFLIDGTKIWEIPFINGTGTVPALSALGTNTLSGDTSLATGEFFRVWATGELEPLSAGSPMPETGYIKLRYKTGDFEAGEIITLPNEATVEAANSGKRSWLQVVGRCLFTGSGSQLTVPRLGSFNIQGDWYELGITDGTDDQEIQLPFRDVCGAIQVETEPNSGEYEWWMSGGQKWYRNTSVGYSNSSNTNITVTFGGQVLDPFNNFDSIRHTETTINGIHRVLFVAQARAAVDRYTFVTYLKRDTRRYGMVQIRVDTTKFYSVLVDLDNGNTALTDSLNSPENPSHVITDMGNGWYKVELSADHTSSALNVQAAISMSNSATPTLNAVERLPTYAGTVTEGMFVYGEEMYAATTEFIADGDNRGKYFGITEDGLITFAKRSDGSAGIKPLSGCKVRVPNIVLSNANGTLTTPEQYLKNVLPKYTRVSRYTFVTTSGGAINISKANINWGNTFSGAFEINISDCSILDGISMTNTADRNRILRCGIGSWGTFGSNSILINTNFTGSRIEDTVTSRLNYTAAPRVISILQSNNTIIKNCRFDAIDSPANNNSRGSIVPVVGYFTGCDNILFEDNVCIGGSIFIDQTTNSVFRNLKYAGFLNGNTEPYAGNDAIFQILNSSSNILCDGLTLFDSLSNVHPHAGTSGNPVGLGIISAYSNNITIQNIGTPEEPIYTGETGGSANMGGLFAVAGTTFNLNFKKIYCTHSRLIPLRTVNTSQSLLFENVWVKKADAVLNIASNDTLLKGCYNDLPGYTAQTSVYGTHWREFFKSDTEGQIVIACNEPLESTVDQCSAVFGGGGGFTSTGAITLVTPNQEEVIWTTPYFILGHTSLGSSLSSINPPFATGPTAATIQNHEFEYQIDKGDGFSDWKFLFGYRLRTGGGLINGTTVTVTNLTTNRPPSAGDFIAQGTTAGPGSKIPLDAKITDYNTSTGIITFDTPLTTAYGANEQVIYWRDIEDEIIDPEIGFRLKVRVRPTELNASNALRFISVPTRTDEISQQIQYLPPVPILQGNILNIVPNSRLQIYNLTNDTEVFNNIIPLSSYSFTYDEGDDFSEGDIARVRLTYVDGLSAKILFETRTIASSNGWSVLADQIDDLIYNGIGIDGSEIDEFITDYPNIEIDIDDPDGETTISRLYAWWVANEYTEDGIRNWAGGLVAEDSANFKIVTSKLNLKLDNLSTTGVQFVGDLRIYRDDNQNPLVSSTTGGGSITLYAGKVYPFAVQIPVLSPQETTQIQSISAIRINTDLIPSIV